MHDNKMSVSCSYLKKMIPEFNQCVDKFLDKLESAANQKTQVSLRDELALLTLTVVSKVRKEAVKRKLEMQQTDSIFRLHLEMISKTCINTFS